LLIRYHGSPRRHGGCLSDRSPKSSLAVEKQSVSAVDRLQAAHHHSINKSMQFAIGTTITRHRTIKRESAISPDLSGKAMFVVFDGVIGTMTIPTKSLEKLSD
jgi:hypothetical protein